MHYWLHNINDKLIDGEYVKIGEKEIVLQLEMISINTCLHL